MLHRIRILTAGESHGPASTVILEGLPAGLEISRDRLMQQMDRRRRGIGRGGRMKIEADEIEILGGLRSGFTLGSPLSILIRNNDFRNWEESMAPWTASNSAPVTRPRPGHADLAGGLKYNHRDLRNVLERASARETVARNAAGAICFQLLERYQIKIASHVLSIGGEHSAVAPAWDDIVKVQESDRLRCVDLTAEKRMIEAIEKARASKETLGGTAEVVAHQVIPGLGSYTHWDRKLDARIGAAMMSIPSVKGMMIGDPTASLSGSSAHDEILFSEDKTFFRKTNHAGGMEGGVSNGEDIVVRLWFKPLSTLMKPLRSVDIETKEPSDAVVERSDTCVVPAGGVVGEAMLALVLADAMLEKFAADSISELDASVQAYREQLRSY